MRLPRYTEGANALRYNPKCVVASGLVVGGYWLLAPSDRRVSVALGLAIATYAGLAHYDRAPTADFEIRRRPFRAVSRKQRSVVTGGNQPTRVLDIQHGFF